MLGMDIAVVDDDIVAITRYLYVKTPGALERLLKELKAIGYEIEDLREDDRRKRDGVSVEQMEQKGWTMWFAKLPDIHRGKCKSCNSLIDIAGIRSHGHICEACGEVTYYHIIDGTTIRFKFTKGSYRDRLFAPQLCMRAKRWDTDEEFLFLYFKFLESRALCAVTDEKTYLAEHEGMWEIVEEDGEQLLKVKYPLVWNPDESAIESYEVFGHYQNYCNVKLWNEQEYGEYERLPIPETICIYEAWHWAPVLKSPTIHARIMSVVGQISDKGWYHQDGRPFFQEGIRYEFAKFIRHFTELDADAFINAWPHFRKSGPGFIDDFAHFCHESPIVEDRPSMANTIEASFKEASGQRLSDREVEAALKGVSDPFMGNVMDMLSEISPAAKELNRQRKAPLN